MVEGIIRMRWIALVAMTMVSALVLVAGERASAQQGVPQQGGIDPVLLVKANAGDAAAQVAVGENYAAGKGVAQDYKAAAGGYQKAADKGDIGGEVHLAGLYRDGGKGFQRDMVQAAAWYQKAADQGDVTAQATMGTLYSMGQGVEQSYAESYYWWDLAAAVKGPRQAQYAANRQMIGAHITADELAAVQEREAAWKAAHPRPNTDQ